MNTNTLPTSFTRFMRVLAGAFITEPYMKIWKEERPRSKKLLVVLLLLFSTITVAVAACGSASTSSSSSGAGTAKEVHMNSTSFVQAALTIQKGQSVTLVNDDAFTPHIIANGAWENGTPKPAKEVGAPSVNNVQINGDSSQTIGPFTTPGTFHFYCTIHPGLELAVIVQ